MLESRPSNFLKKWPKTNKTISDLETKLKHFEKHENNIDNIDYKFCKQQLNSIYKEKGKGIKTRSKCNWCKHGEKSSKFFLNLKNIVQSKVKDIRSLLTKMKLKIMLK